MRRHILFAVCTMSALMGCTSSQELAAIQLATNALPCYEAISAATKTGAAPTKILTGASVAVMDPACAAVDTASLTLIASAINARAPVVAAPASVPVSAPASGPVPAVRRARY